MRKPVLFPSEKVALVFQGGGALGAYQAGAFSGLSAAGYEPNWIAGISIGAINAAIIAGNKPEDRSEKLRAFWDRVSSTLTGQPFYPGADVRTMFNEWASLSAVYGGIPGFFAPRFPPAAFMPFGSTGAVSYYDTGPLERTLEELVDFDRLNNDNCRLSVGAVNVETGNFAYFDSQSTEITPQHIMASGALPPGFPPVMIEGQAYWDGGLVSNTPLQYLLDENEPHADLCIFQIDLFSARGQMPKSLFDVAQREKDIRFSSRTRLNTDFFKRMQLLRSAARRLVEKIPEDLRQDRDVQMLESAASGSAITIVHLIHRKTAYETQSKDYEFSRLSVNEHWKAGEDDVARTFRHKAWRNRQLPQEDGIEVFDLTQDGA